MTLKDIETALKDPKLADGPHEVRLTLVTRGGAWQATLQDSNWKSESSTSPSLEAAVRSVFEAHDISV